MLKAAFGEARANALIIFFIIAGALWVVLTILEKVFSLAQAVAGKEGVVYTADVGEMVLAVGVMLFFTVVFVFAVIRTDQRKELGEIRAELAEIRRFLETHSHEDEAESNGEDDTHGKVHTDD